MMGSFVAIIAPSESSPFCLHARVEAKDVSIAMVPEDVIVPPDNPRPAVTDVTVPPPLADINAANESSPFCLQARVAILNVSVARA